MSKSPGVTGQYAGQGMLIPTGLVHTKARCATQFVMLLTGCLMQGMVKCIFPQITTESMFSVAAI